MDKDELDEDELDGSDKADVSHGAIGAPEAETHDAEVGHESKAKNSNVCGCWTTGSDSSESESESDESSNDVCSHTSFKLSDNIRVKSPCLSCHKQWREQQSGGR